MKKKKRNTIEDLQLDKPTSHGGWPGGENRGWIASDKRSVAKIISDYFKDMGLAPDNLPTHARLSESDLRKVIRKVLIELYNY
jgi:hypothetical protein